jgi:hypothetical protein
MGDAGARKAQKIGEGLSISAEQKHFNADWPRGAEAACDQTRVMSGYAYESSIACGDPPAGRFRFLLSAFCSAGMEIQPVSPENLCGTAVTARLISSLVDVSWLQDLQQEGPPRS